MVLAYWPGRAGSNLTTNLRDFFGITRGKTSKAVKRQEEQDLKGFGSSGKQLDVHCYSCRRGSKSKKQNSMGKSHPHVG